MSKFKTVEYFSLNRAADACNVNRQEFRKYVGEFEKQTFSYLPKDEEGHKLIPEDLLQIFQRAVLWAKVEDGSPGQGMLKALERGQQYHLEMLAEAVSNTQDLVKLPREMRQVVHELKEAAKVPRRVSVNVTDTQQVARALASLKVWQGTVCVLLGVIAGLFLGHRFL